MIAPWSTSLQSKPLDLVRRAVPGAQGCDRRREAASYRARWLVAKSRVDGGRDLGGSRIRRDHAAGAGGRNASRVDGLLPTLRDADQGDAGCQRRRDAAQSTVGDDRPHVRQDREFQCAT